MDSNGIDHVLVERLWQLYSWPERSLPVRNLTVEKLKAYRVESTYVSDDWRTWHRVKRAWDYGRIRHFVEHLQAGGSVDPIEIDNACNGGRIYPVPVLFDGHHRLAAAHLAGVRTIPAHYSGRVDLLRYLKGLRKTAPLV